MNKIRYIFLEANTWSPITSFISSNFKGVNSASKLKNYLYRLSQATNNFDIKRSTEGISRKIETTFMNANRDSTNKFFSKTFQVLSEGLLNIKNHLKYNDLPESIIVPRTNAIQLFTREFIVLVLFSAFLGLFPDGIFNSNTPGLSFNGFFSSSRESSEQLSCLLDYFNIMASRISMKDPIVNDYVIFERHYQVASTEEFYLSSKNQILQVEIIKGYMETYNPGTHAIEAIFGNKHIGSAVLRNVMHQEEILMSVATETLISRIFHTDLTNEEVLSFRGLLKYSSYKGYGSRSFTYLPANEEDQIKSVTRVYASVDAICDQNRPRQFTTEYSLRELNKLLPVLCKDFYGESEAAQRSPFVSGYWGSGVFGGDRKYKFIIQLIAACACNRRLVYADADGILNVNQVRAIESKYRTCGSLARALFKLEKSGILRSGNTLDRLLDN